MIWYSKPQQSRDKTWDLTKPKKCKAQENINLFTNTAFHVHLQNQKNSLTWTTQSNFSLIIFAFFCEENTSYPRDTDFLLQGEAKHPYFCVFSSKYKSHLFVCLYFVFNCCNFTVILPVFKEGPSHSRSTWLFLSPLPPFYFNHLYGSWLLNRISTWNYFQEWPKSETACSICLALLKIRTSLNYLEVFLLKKKVSALVLKKTLNKQNTQFLPKYTYSFLFQSIPSTLMSPRYILEKIYCVTVKTPVFAKATLRHLSSFPENYSQNF